MVGQKHSSEVLNNTLLLIIKILNDNNIKNWFIAYGTLLGMIRDNSCINGDDDIDIIIDKSNRELLKKLLIENNIQRFDKRSRRINKPTRNTMNIIKTIPNDKFSSIDFYMADIDEKGNFKDNWEKVTWSECYGENNELIPMKWRGNLLYIPNNAELKLQRRYGDSWKTPMNSKGPKPRKSII